VFTPYNMCQRFCWLTNSFALLVCPLSSHDATIGLQCHGSRQSWWAPISCLTSIFNYLCRTWSRTPFALRQVVSAVPRRTLPYMCWTLPTQCRCCWASAVWTIVKNVEDACFFIERVWTAGRAAQKRFSTSQVVGMNLARYTLLDK